MTETCPLCFSQQTADFFSDNKREYLQCNHCKLVFVPKRFHLNNEQEKAEYDKHQNSVDDFGYRNFLSRLATPLMDELESEANGLDFGCGKGPALMAMFEEQGFNMQGYDLYYRNDTSVLGSCYDFITLTEVIEHLASPNSLLKQLWAILNERGNLGVMTKLVIDKEAFAKWHYKNDPTHIAFYSVATFEFMADWLNAGLKQVASDAIILFKN